MDNTEDNNFPLDYEDDFANDPEVQEWRKMQAEYDKLIKDCTDILIQALSLVEIEETSDIESYELLRSVKIVDYHSFKSTNEQLPVEILVSEYYWEHRTPKNVGSGHDHCLFGIITLSREHPLTYVYRETIKEKIVNWFVKGDVDFGDQKNFSNQFHVVTKDKDKLQLLWGNKPLDELIAFPAMELEINNNKCLYRSFKAPINEELTREFAELTKMLCRIFR